MKSLSRPAVLYVAGFAGLLAAVPVRTPDLWKHLADGRGLLHGKRPSGTWLFDLLAYLSDGLAGGAGVAAAKTAAVAVVGAVLARAAGGGLIAAVSVSLGVLACGPRLLSLYTLPLLLLALLVDRLRAEAPRWQLLLVAVVWANVDRWVWVGAGVAALTLLGRAIDTRRAGGFAVTVLLLAAAAMLNPAVLTGHDRPFDLGGAGLALRSPFSPDYREAVAANPAGLAYCPLLVLSAASFLLGRWRWERALPWLGLAAASAAQARFVPMFAVVAGPVLAWNLSDRFTGPARLRVKLPLVLAGAGLLAVAWPGWLLGPPYESRRLAVDLPAAVEESAKAVAALGPPGRTLHLSPDTLHGFAWFLPAEAGELVDPSGEAVRRFLSGEGADRAVLLVTGPTPLSPAARAVAGTDPRTLAHFGGGAMVFARSPVEKPVDLDRLGFGPAALPQPPPPADWFTPFVRPRAVWSADRGEAAAGGALADAAGPSALARHAAEWDAALTAGLVGAAGVAGPADLATRFTLLAPPVTPTGGRPPVTEEVFGLLRQFALLRDDVPVGAAFAAVRAARRATLADPTDAAAFHLLGEAYLRLHSATRERLWAAAVPPLAEVRRAQIATALERAVQLNPRRRDTHLLLARLYRDVGYIDLVVEHLRAAGETPDDLLVRELAERRATLEKETATARVLDKAQMAVRVGLGGEARRLLLGSDVAAFGSAGVELELVLLNRTGRAADTLRWTTPELATAVGGEPFHRLRATAAAAVGDYPTADAELAELGGAGVPPWAWARAVGDRVLSEEAGGEFLPTLILRVVAESDFMTTVARLVRDEDQRVEVEGVRGLLALEAGDAVAARRLFAETTTTNRPSTTGGQMGRAGLGWLARGEAGR